MSEYVCGILMNEENGIFIQTKRINIKLIDKICNRFDFRNDNHEKSTSTKQTPFHHITESTIAFIKSVEPVKKHQWLYKEETVNIEKMTIS